MIYHLTFDDMAEISKSSKEYRKNQYTKVLATVQQAIAMIPDKPGRLDYDDNRKVIVQQFQILEGLLLKATL